MVRPNTFQGKPMTFHESLHWCGCGSCALDISELIKSEPPLKPDFVAHLRAEYPKTARLFDTMQAEQGAT